MRNLLINPYLSFSVYKTSSDIPYQRLFFFFFNISVVLSEVYQLLLIFQRISFAFVNFQYRLLSILLISALNNVFPLLHVSIKLNHHFSFLYKF